jgi:hypothetical protein
MGPVRDPTLSSHTTGSRARWTKTRTFFSPHKLILYYISLLSPASSLCSLYSAPFRFSAALNRPPSSSTRATAA